MPRSDKLADKVKALYIQHLAEHFGEKVKFDTVLVEPAVNSEGRDFFRVTVVYDDEHGNPAPLTRAHVLGALMDPLEELGLPAVMLESYVPKSEYPLLLELRANPPPWDDEDNPWDANENEDWDEDEE